MNVEFLQPSQLSSDQIDLWRSFHRANEACASPFFAPEFTLATAAERRDVEVAVLREGAEISGFFPFQCSRWRIGRPVGWRLNDFQGPVLRPGATFDPVAMFRRRGLACWCFDHLEPRHELLRPGTHFWAESPYIELTEGFDSYYHRRKTSGSDTIRRLETKTRKLDRELGPVRFELASKDGGAFRQLLQWKSDHLRHTRSLDVLRFRWVRGLLERIWNMDSPHFQGLLSTLHAGDRLVAAHLGMRAGPVLHWWITSYDHACDRYSPGLTLLLRVAREAAVGGVNRIDLGKGDEPYKRSFMTGSVQVGEGAVNLWPLSAPATAAWFRGRQWVRRRKAAQWPKYWLRRLHQWANPEVLR